MIELGEVCRVRVGPHWTVGTPCAHCGHTDHVHPGVPNPALSSCVVCELVTLHRRLRAKWGES